MKAKEYAEMYTLELAERDGNRMETLAVVLQRMVEESAQLVKARRCQTPGGILAVHREMCQKYKAFCNLVSDEDCKLKPDGLETFLKQVYPELWTSLTNLEFYEKFQARARQAARESLLQVHPWGGER